LGKVLSGGVVAKRASTKFRVGVHRLRQVEDVLVEERHLVSGVGVVVVDAVCSVPPATGTVPLRVAKYLATSNFEVVEQHQELAVGRRENEPGRVQIDDARACRGERCEDRLDGRVTGAAW